MASRERRRQSASTYATEHSRSSRPSPWSRPCSARGGSSPPTSARASWRSRSRTWNEVARWRMPTPTARDARASASGVGDGVARDARGRDPRGHRGARDGAAPPSPGVRRRGAITSAPVRTRRVFRRPSRVHRVSQEVRHRAVLPRGTGGRKRRRDGVPTGSGRTRGGCPWGMTRQRRRWRRR